MRFVDLSHPLVDRAPAFPNDPKMALIEFGRIATHNYNITQVVMGTHQGTHLDAMFHFFDSGRTVDQMPLDWFFGPARMLCLPKGPNAEITPEDLRPHEASLQPGGRIILNTGWHRHFGGQRFFEDFPSLTVDAARYLASRRIRLLGMDMPTPGKQWLEIHHVLLAKEAEIVVVEALANLDALPDEFTFVGFPLNFKGKDGSPIRAVGVCEN
ncbi:MAG: cyclase family protein [Limisphaerales bacterium]